MEKIERVGGVILIILMMAFAILWKAGNKSEIEELRTVLKSESPGQFDRAMSKLSIEYKKIEQGKIDLALKQQATEGFEEIKRQKELQSAIALIPWKAQAYQVMFYGGFSTIFFCAIALSLGYNRRHGIVEQHMGDGIVLRIRHKDLSKMMPVVNGFMVAKQLETEGSKESLDRSMELNRLLFQAAKAGLAGKPMLPEPEPMKDVTPALPAYTPSFKELLDSGGIAPKQPMILAYHEGQPIKGAFDDIYSSGVAGESGSGKSGTECYLIGSGLISYGKGNIDFRVIDPHYPHHKSLGKKIEPLVEAELIDFASFFDDMLTILKGVIATIDRRLSGQELSAVPVVLVLDEVTFLAKSERVKAILFETMERISTEGRKCNVFMLASAQVWTVKRMGSSAVRDTLTSAYVHRIKPNQARALLQDKDEVDRVKKYVKKPGEVLFIPVGEDSKVCQVPLTVASDMREVAKRVANGPAVSVASNVPVDLTKSKRLTTTFPDVSQAEVNFPGNGNGAYQGGKVLDFPQKLEQEEDTEVEVDLISQIREWLECDGNTQKELARETGISAGFLSKVLNGTKPLPSELRGKLQDFFRGQALGNSECDNFVT